MCIIILYLIARWLFFTFVILLGGGISDAGLHIRGKLTALH